MPQAITHFLIAAILVALFRDFFLNKSQKKNFPLHYVLIAGLGGLLPDFDIAVYYVLSFFGFSINEVHRTFSHNIFFILILVILGLLFMGARNKELGKHKLRLSTIFFVLGFGVLVHLLLDLLIDGSIMPFYPIYNMQIGLNPVKLLPLQFQNTIIQVIDAIILIFWMIYLELKHKLSDYI